MTTSLTIPRIGPSHPNAKVEFKLGDVTTTMIKVQQWGDHDFVHDTNLLRPIH